MIFSNNDHNIVVNGIMVLMLLLLLFKNVCPSLACYSVIAWHFVVACTRLIIQATITQGDQVFFL